jgi:uncharacterized membrane protein YbaN (DUF454 family)
MMLEIGVLIVAIVTIVAILTHAILWRRSAKLHPSMIFILRIALGIIFTLLGIIGSLLPIMQGWIFFLLAALVLFPRSRFAIKACDKIETKMPRLVARLRRMGIGVHEEEPGHESIHHP